MYQIDVWICNFMVTYVWVSQQSHLPGITEFHCFKCPHVSLPMCPHESPCVKPKHVWVTQPSHLPGMTEFHWFKCPHVSPWVDGQLNLLLSRTIQQYFNNIIISRLWKQLWKWNFLFSKLSDTVLHQISSTCIMTLLRPNANLIPR